MIIENETALQRWLANELKPISDADPVALAMYVVALLKHHNKTGDDLKTHCYEQLIDFLKDDSPFFLESLFNVLQDGSYKIEDAHTVEDDDNMLRARGDDDFEDEEDDSRRRDRRRGSDSGDDEDDNDSDHDDRRKRSKRESASSSSSQSARTVNPIRSIVTTKAVVTETKVEQMPAVKEKSQWDRKEHMQSLNQSQPQGRTYQQNKLSSYVPAQQPYHQQQPQLPLAQTLSARVSNDIRLMSAFDGMGPETQRAIFSAMGTSMGGAMGGSIGGTHVGIAPSLLALQQQQRQQHALGVVAQRPRETKSSDYSRNVGANGDITSKLLPYTPSYGTVSLPFTASFPPLPAGIVLPIGKIEIEKSVTYPLTRPLPPSTEFPGPVKKPAPPSAPPPQKQLPQQQQQLQGDKDQLQQQWQQKQQQQQEQQLYPQQWRQDRNDSRGQSNYGMQSSRQGQGQGQNYDQYSNNTPHNSLPEHEKCTLKCTGLPKNVKEADLRGHFKQFGRVVELQLVETEGDKKYNECLVQMGTAQEAKKCLNSPSAVLNNRFVRLLTSSFNIVPFADVLPEEKEEAPSSAVKDANAASAAHTARQTKRWVNEEAPAAQRVEEAENAWTPGAGAERRARGVGLHGRGFGVSNKFVADHSKAAPILALTLASASASAFAASSSSSAPHSSSSATTAATATASEEPEEDSLYGGLELNDPTPAEPVAAAAVSVPLTKEDIALQQQYEGLRALRQQADSIWKQKEALLQGQIDQYRIMIEKLESSPDNPSRATLLENIEGKIVDLQSQLRSVKEQRETGVVPQQAAPVYGGRGGRGYAPTRGRGRGGVYYPSYGAGRGRGFDEGYGAGRGRGRFGGRGDHPGYLALDNRTRSLVVFQPPTGFDASAQEHFSRFGEVLDINPSNDGSGSLTVQFKERRDAETAKAKGAFYNSTVLLLDWQEADASTDL